MISVDIQRETRAETPNDEAIKRTVVAALGAASGEHPDAEVSLRIVDREEMRKLNHHYRQKDYATNVLSFPADLPGDLGLSFLGDIAVCAPVVHDEAAQQGKPAPAHWDHMLVHGVLHLLGYDHEQDDDAQAMESLETRVLATLGWPDPYLERGVEAVVP